MRASSSRRRWEKGQAIVLIAVMLAVVVGMAALAIDGSRAYALRRDLQAAVDAAALAAADRLQQSDSFTSAEQAASTIFGTDARLYGAPSCAPGYGTPGASPFTVTCTYSDGTTLTEVASDLGPQGGQFTLTAARSLGLQFARILTNGSNPRIVATASGGVGNLRDSPTLEALDPAGCGGVPGAAISAPPGGTLTVVGDVVSNGAISLGSSTAAVAGDVYARCQSSVPGVVNECYPSGDPTPCTYPDVAGATRSGFQAVDPVYPLPVLAGGAQARPGSNVVLSPGVYASDPSFGSGLCYFLSGGVYKWQGGYTNNGAFVSNELRPPDEPSVSDNTEDAPHQFWDVDANCSGSAQVTSVPGARGIPNGTWAFVLTSTRTDTYNGLTYGRESAPSVCYTVFVNGGGRNVQIQVSNVPGATAYNIYAAPSGSCSGPFGLAASLPVVGTPQNNSTFFCPVFSGPGCSLGNEAIVLDATILGPPFAPNPLAMPGVTGSFPPSSETAPLRNNLANDNADRATPPAGDRANENQCDTVGGTLTTCPGAITPGAVEYYIPSGGCINDKSSGDNYLFSGYQYDWMMVYEPGAGTPPANTCSNFLGAARDSALIGLIYTPSAAITIQKASTFRTDEVGGLIADTITFSGQLPTILGDTADYGPVPPAGRLTG
ncbi:MAG: pilus assembly protein TadG-related protein [Candidatus Dormiibacterota bacterium]